MQVVIVAGGLGTRLKPITEAIPKPMIEFNGKPFLWYLINSLKNSGFKDIVLCIGYKHEVIEDYFGDNYKGMKIRYSVEDKPLGTGGAIKHAAKFLDNNFLLIWGDSYFTINYWDVIEKFNKLRTIGLMAVYDNVKEKVGPNNIFYEGDFVRGYYKRDKHDIDLNKHFNSSIIEKLNGVDAGISVYSRKILDFFPNEEIFPFEFEIYPQLIKINQLAAFVTDSRFYDIGTFERLEIFKQVLVK